MAGSSFQMFEAGIFTNSANAPSRSMPMMRRFWQICDSPRRHWWQWPQLKCISALTLSPALTADTSSPTCSTTPLNSCPNVTGGLMRPCDQRSHPYICRSVPQMDAAVTRTRTSVGPIEGTGAHSSDNPAPARILRKAFICPDLVTDINRGSQVQRNFWMVAHYPWMTLFANPRHQRAAYCATTIDLRLHARH